MAKIGLRSGRPFAVSDLPPDVATAVRSAPKTGRERIKTQMGQGAKTVNGWMITTKAGTYGTDYLQRAFVAAIGLGANVPEQAIYPFAATDDRRSKLSGENRYVVHFAAGATPPVEGFWSITMYTPQMFFYANPLKRYTVGSRTAFHKGADGSIDVYVQHDPPASRQERANWLPAPEGDFRLMMRLYWPRVEPPSLLDGSWQPPAVARAAGAPTAHAAAP
jgi:hypothetical protein